MTRHAAAAGRHRMLAKKSNKQTLEVRAGAKLYLWCGRKFAVHNYPDSARLLLPELSPGRATLNFSELLFVIILSAAETVFELRGVF